MQTPIHKTVITSPLGNLELVETDSQLTACHFTEEPVSSDCSFPVLQQAATQLQEYFAGKRQKFALPLAFQGTDFQKQVWQELLEIPYGETRSYQQVAEAIGNPQAVRAVGSANGKNPLCIIVPCHRVIRASGELGGYGGGLDKKMWLLQGEKAPVATGAF